MALPENALTQAERHVREGEKRVARQISIIEELDRDNHPEAAARARAMLETLRETLELARAHVQRARETRGLGG
ncbi:hypothetical protein [Paracraurococcus lichenis]|uniref:Uncharacterized protein n=1 Tax=Paracraurococcus lichenis TaxID=3064888 RepID=A0ABT9E8U9_9PROT|nr:hypothetical protein [Paracraurococcus sp. LOR1-02]MDO9712490.1 hypothetical protein [Paracraurococcus sp. LOR1-02]